MKLRRRRRFHMQQTTLCNFRIVLVLATLVLMGSIAVWMGKPEYTTASMSLRHNTHHPPVREQWVTNEALPFNDQNCATEAKHLIVVAGHSVTLSGHLEDADHDEHDWYLLSYQKHRGLPEAIVGHISAGISFASDHADTLLVFSGGATRTTTGPETEGASYFRVADAMDLWKTNVRARTTTEEFAKDSFQNLLFSVCRFREVTGHYPESISVVSFSFKQTRFEELHAQALRWPANQFHYIPFDPPASTGFDLAQATQGERENSVLPFRDDLYGCHSSVLQDKRRQRNPFFRTPPYALSCPEMRLLLDYCGPELIPESQVPWKADP